MRPIAVGYVCRMLPRFSAIFVAHAVLELEGCLENFSYCGRRHWFEMHTIAEMLNPLCKSIHCVVPSTLVEVVRSQLVIRFHDLVIGLFINRYEFGRPI